MLTIRPGEPGDAGAITRVHVTGWQWAYRGLVPAGYLAAMDPADPERVARRRDHLSTVDTLPGTVVAVDGDDLVGFANFGAYRRDDAHPDRRGEPVAGGGEVYAIYQLPQRYGTGVGRALMDSAVAHLTGRGLLPVRLWVLAGNARALTFYRRYGFGPDGGRGTFTVEQSGELPVEVDELRLRLAGRDRQ
jgi:GNAT superfamily N-acetyltransferase